MICHLDKRGNIITAFRVFQKKKKKKKNEKISKASWAKPDTIIGIYKVQTNYSDNSAPFLTYYILSYTPMQGFSTYFKISEGIIEIILKKSIVLWKS